MDHHTQTSRPVSQSSITASPAGTATSAYVSMSCFEKAKCELDTVDWYVYYMLCHEIGLQSVSNSLVLGKICITLLAGEYRS